MWQHLCLSRGKILASAILLDHKYIVDVSVIYNHKYTLFMYTIDIAFIIPAIGKISKKYQ